MKKTFIAIGLGFVMLSSSLQFTGAQEIKFSDINEGHNNNVAIQYLVKSGVFKGYDDGTFKPDRILNKAEALKIIVEGASISTEGIDTNTGFSDVSPSDWFAKYVAKGKELGIVSGNPDGTFLPGKNVSRAEFMKMVLLANTFKSSNWEGKSMYKDVPADSWFAPYMNFAGSSGLILKDEKNELLPGKELSRGEVSEILYLLTVMLKGNDVQFLISQSEAQMRQVENFMNVANVTGAKRSAELAVDFTQQAYKLLPANNVVLGVAKLAKAYDFVMTGFMAGVSKNKNVAIEYSNKAIEKANEALEVNSELSQLAEHIKSRANEIKKQVEEL